MRPSSCHTLLMLAAAALHSAFSCAADPQTYEVDFVASGNRTLDSTLKETSQLLALRAAAPVSPFGLIARARSDIGRLKTVLASYGYYQGSVAIRIDGLALEDPKLAETLSALPAGTDAHCSVAASLGPLYHLGRVDIDGSIPPDARQALGLASGAPAVAADVVAAGARLLAALEDAGYAFAKVDAPIAYEDPDQQLLDVSFHVETGPRVAIGEITIAGLHKVHESVLRRRLPLRTGEPYSATKVERARKSLLALGVFRGVGVRLADAPDGAGRVPVTFQVQERPRRAVAFNAAYSTDLGGSGGVTWTNRNVRGNADQLSLSASVINVGGNATSGLGYDISAKYLIPDVRRTDQSLQFGLSALRQFLDAYDQTAQTASVTARRKLSSVWSIGAGVSVERDEIVQQGETHDYDLFAVSLSGFYDSTNLASPLDDPRHGVRFTLTVTPTYSAGPTDATFIVTQATLATYFDLRALTGADPGRSVLALRALGGLARGASALDLPPDQRFYAGGGGTIRGYRYQSVGPKFPDGDPIGGTAFTAGSIELRQRFGTSLGAVVFADAGQVSDHPEAGEYRVGAGAGLRYYTPIGPIRFDVALPVKRQAGDDAFEIYIGLGQAF